MTKDEIIEMAKQAGIIFGYPAYHDRIAIFAKLVAAKEREACAKVCDEDIEKWGSQADVEEVAEAIRARGQA